MNRIGLQATGQQGILTNSHDSYTIELRHRGGTDWWPTHFAQYPAEVAMRFVRDLNLTGSLVYRAVLVNGVNQ